MAVLKNVKNLMNIASDGLFSDEFELEILKNDTDLNLQKRLCWTLS
jgi:hypothetical protein